MNIEYYKPGGPIMFLFSGESTISKGFMVTGLMIENAKQFGAICFQLEHRYYGKSIPTRLLVYNKNAK